MTAFGDLRIVASAKIGGAGSVEGEPVLYYWPWYWHLSRIGPWVLLALAVGAARRNRDRRAILIFVPLAILSLLWPVVVRLVSLPSGSVDQFALLFESLVVGLALLWLNADKFSGYYGLVRVPMSLGILLLAGLVTSMSSGRTISDPVFIVLPIFVAVTGAILLGALALTRRMTHRRYVPFPFMLWLAVWSLLITMAGTALFFTVLLMISQGTINAPLLFFQTMMGGALGLCLYAVNLPYMLLMFRSSFFRQRFHVWLGGGSSL